MINRYIIIICLVNELNHEKLLIHCLLLSFKSALMLLDYIVKPVNWDNLSFLQKYIRRNTKVASFWIFSELMVKDLLFYFYKAGFWAVFPIFIL